MKRWFDALPVHRKLVAMALLVTTMALTVATLGLITMDVWRYRVAATDDITSLAEIMSENIAAALMFQDQEAAIQTLATARVRPMVTRACAYLADGTLFASYTREGQRLKCPARLPVTPASGLFGTTSPVLRNHETVGMIYAERDLSDLGTRITVAGLIGVGMLLLAAGLAYGIAQRLHRTVSTPIVQLAAVARSADADSPIPTIDASHDEVGELVRAFTDMMNRVRQANEGLRQSNEALRQEVDERRRVEAEREILLAREREASRLKDEFLAAVSHELRTPLHAILGWAHLLTNAELSSDTVTKAVASIARNAQAQTRVIEDLVDVSRIVTGKLHLHSEKVDLRNPAEGALDVMRPAARAKNVVLDVNLGLPCFVNGDRDRMQQIVWNLLSNAVKFTPAGGTVSMTLTQDEGGCILQVSDTGIGISSDFLPHVFDRFRQADGSMTREHGGLGLGLAIVKELTELHGGTVSVSSRGRSLGTTFTMKLPALTAPEFKSEDGAIAGPITASPSLTHVRVLAVDDNSDALDIATVALENAGALVRVATSGAEAIEAWRREPADVLICDLAMPEMTGFDVLRTIQQRDAAAGRRTRAIALSAHASLDHLVRCRAAGFDQHLAKPYAADELVKAVVAAMEVS